MGQDPDRRPLVGRLAGRLRGETTWQPAAPRPPLAPAELDGLALGWRRSWVVGARDGPFGGVWVSVAGERPRRRGLPTGTIEELDRLWALGRRPDHADLLTWWGDPLVPSASAGCDCDAHATGRRLRRSMASRRRQATTRGLHLVQAAAGSSVEVVDLVGDAEVVAAAEQLDHPALEHLLVLARRRLARRVAALVETAEGRARVRGVLAAREAALHDRSRLTGRTWAAALGVGGAEAAVVTGDGARRERGGRPVWLLAPPPPARDDEPAYRLRLGQTTIGERGLADGTRPRDDGTGARFQQVSTVQIAAVLPALLAERSVRVGGWRAHRLPDWLGAVAVGLGDAAVASDVQMDTAAALVNDGAYDRVDRALAVAEAVTRRGGDRAGGT